MKQTVGNLPCTSTVTQTYVSVKVCEGSDRDSYYVNKGLVSNTIVDETSDMLLFPISSKEEVVGGGSSDSNQSNYINNNVFRDLLPLDSLL